MAQEAILQLSNDAESINEESMVKAPEEFNRIRVSVKHNGIGFMVSTIVT